MQYGVLNLAAYGVGEAPLLARQLVNDKTPYPYYAMYYTTQAAFQAGEPVWSTVWQATTENQRPYFLELN